MEIVAVYLIKYRNIIGRISKISLAVLYLFLCVSLQTKYKSCAYNIVGHGKHVINRALLEAVEKQ